MVRNTLAIVCESLTFCSCDLPISDFNLRAEFTGPSKAQIQNVALPLTSSQLLGKEAPLSVVLQPGPETPGLAPQLAQGTYSVRWLLDDPKKIPAPSSPSSRSTAAVAGARLLAHADVRVLSPAAFQQSLYVADGRFLTQAQEGDCLLRHHLLARDNARNLRPCFLIASREPGLKGLCTLEIRVQFRDPKRGPLLSQEEILVTDKPSLLVPQLLAHLQDWLSEQNTLALADNVQEIRTFELLSKGQLLGALPVQPTPSAVFTNEGGFRAAADFAWTPFSEEELWDHLEKLIDASEKSKGFCSSGL